MKDTPLEQAAHFLPLSLREAVLQGERDAEEIRLRNGQPLHLTGRDGREYPVLQGTRPLIVTSEMMSRTLERVTGASYHTVAEKLSQGFVSLDGGHRLGVAGTVDVSGGKVHGFRSISSLCLRIAHEVPGVGEAWSQALFGGAELRSVLILAPPGAGKTTLLRDLIRLASDRHHLRVGLADERGEVAALRNGMPQLCVGEQTDVLDGCPKAEGLLLLMKTMNPQLLAADEITAPGDVQALSVAANCGVALLATAHGASLRELERRPLYRRLLQEGIFTHVMLIRRDGPRRWIQLEALHD